MASRRCVCASAMQPETAKRLVAVGLGLLVACFGRCTLRLDLLALGRVRRWFVGVHRSAQRQQQAQTDGMQMPCVTHVSAVSTSRRVDDR